VEGAEYGLSIFNPDGGEAEKSGNGLRIFSRYLHDIGCVENETFSVWTKGGIVQSRVRDDGLIVVDMGRVSFASNKIPVLRRNRRAMCLMRRSSSADANTPTAPPRSGTRTASCRLRK
jgi:diaminopimelate epimerase